MKNKKTGKQHAMKISINLVKILGKQFVIDNFMQILYIEK